MSGSVAARARRRTATISSQLPSATIYDPPQGRTHDLLQIPSASDPELNVREGRSNSTSAPASRFLGGDLRADESTRPRASSVAHGGRGTSVAVRLSAENYRGSEVIAAIERDIEAEGASRRTASATHLSQHEEEEEEGSDYTTDGSEFDEDEHHLDEIVDVSREFIK